MTKSFGHQLRVLARDAKVRVNVVMFTANAQRINETFKELDPQCDMRVIEVDPSSVRSAFEIRRCVEEKHVRCVRHDLGERGETIHTLSHGRTLFPSRNRRS